ncbi:hypothetical protein AB0M92_24525 [Streptomyces sp. NPDC051582]|uniref:hypothetical protein n=1 Tax=Streptomyces sp. NPDC051582 TaxID=3155167 RepID=UPI003434F444
MEKRSPGSIGSRFRRPKSLTVQQSGRNPGEMAARLLCSCSAGVRAPDGWPAAAPLDQEWAVEVDAVGDQGGAAQKLQ